MQTLAAAAAESSLLVPLAALVVLGIGAQWLAWRLRVPSILLLLISGFIAGPAVFGLVDPDKLLGDLLMPLVSISVALILYEGGLTLHFAELPSVASVVRNLCSLGAVVTWAVAAAAAWFFFGLDIRLAILLGAVLVVTGPTVIGPMLRHIRPAGATGPILKWEGIVIDPIGALLAVLVFEAILTGGSGRAATANVAASLLKTIFVGGGLGLIGAAILAILLRRYLVPDYLQNAVSLMLVVAAFAASNRVQPESGLLAVTVMGMALANQKLADVKHIVEFKENLRVLLISALFIILAARLELEDLQQVWLPGIGFVAVLVLAARPLSIYVSTLGSKLNGGERVFLACMAPRGIVAAAVSSVFALRLENNGLSDARLLVPITFIAVIGTVLIYGLTGPWVARRVGLSEPDPQGLLIVGASRWARELAALVQGKGFRVRLVDSNRDNINAARMAGLPVYSGSILAERAVSEIDLGGIGRLIAATANDWVNTLAAQRYRGILGSANCYQLPPRGETDEKKSAHRHLHGRWLFARNASFGELEKRVLRGATVKATPLSESFDFAAFRELYGADALPMFVLTAEGKLNVIPAESKLEPQAGQTLISLVYEAARPEKGDKREGAQSPREQAVGVPAEPTA